MGIPASLQWSFGKQVLALDDLENAAAPTLPGATRTLLMGPRQQFADITVPESPLKSGGTAATLVSITEHATHRSNVLVVDTTTPTVGTSAMTLDVPAARRSWTGFDLLTFRLAVTLDITDVIAYAASPLPKAALVLVDTRGRSRRVDATAFTPGAPATPAFHLVDYDHAANGASIENATLFRFETMRVPLAEFQKAGGVDLGRVKQVIVEFDQTNGTRVLFDSFQLVKR